MKICKHYLKFAVIIVFFLPFVLPPDILGQAVSEELLKSLNYRSIGPTRQSGRFVDFAVPKQQPFTFYAATGSGGLWKTTNNGITFDPIFDLSLIHI